MRKMRIKSKILIPISALIFISMLVMLAYADIPPPPVNQYFGVNDTLMIKYNEPLCRGCHNTTSSPLITGGVPTRHHNLVATNTINPYTGTPFNCQHCHPTVPGTNGVLMNRNCMDCHNITSFVSYGAKVGNFTRPHHNTTYAQQRNCKFCHGASVENYDDGHYIPTYPPSEITPGATYRAYNTTSGRLWGGCLACHQQDESKNPPIYFTGTIGWPPVTTGENNVHHSEINTITAVVNPGDNQCLWCHVDTLDVLNIRGCETCHSVRALHNTQYKYNETRTLIGYGHIGSNNDSDGKNASWDCNGCHAWYDAGSDNPFGGAIVPDVQTATPDVFRSNTPTVITLVGSNYVQENSTTVVNIDDATNLTPDSITDDKITVTANLPAGKHYIKVVKTDILENVPKQSGIKSLTVVDSVTITSARLRSGVITITGSGFGPQPTDAQQYVTINKRNGNVYSSDSITSWSDTQIKVRKTSTPAAVKGDKVIVMTANGGEATATIT